MTHDELYAEIGRRIRFARERHGMKQGELAAAVSLTRTSITNIEQGRQRLLVHTLCDIGVALNEEPSALLPSLDALGARGGALSPAEATTHLERAVNESLSEQEWEWIRSTIPSPEKRG